MEASFKYRSNRNNRDTEEYADKNKTKQFDIWSCYVRISNTEDTMKAN